MVMGCWCSAKLPRVAKNKKLIEIVTATHSLRMVGGKIVNEMLGVFALP